MFNFQFHNPTRICFGKDEIQKLGALVPAGSRVLVLYGGGSIKKNGVYDQVKQALADHFWLEFSGIGANPQYDCLMQAVEIVKREKIDFLLAVGGGSVADGTKFVAAAAHYQGDDPWEILKGAKVERAVPMGVVLTLPATGSESNAGAVISRGESKLSFMSPHVHPIFAVLDPVSTFTLPPKQISNGVIDAVVHILEQYLNRPVGGEVQDRMSEALLHVLFENGPKALAEPDNYEVRANIMWAATLALNGLIGCGVPQDWATHIIGHQFTAIYGLDHGQTLALVMPSLMREQLEHKEFKLCQMGRRLFGLVGEDSPELAEQAIAALEAFFTTMHTAIRLSQYQLDESAVTAVVESLERHGFTQIGELGRIDLATAKNLLTRAL